MLPKSKYKVNFKKMTLIAVLIVGGIYGFVSAVCNQNPYYPKVGGETSFEEQAWDWEPSPTWLPSYLLCKVAKRSQGNWAGVTYTKSGFLFRSRTDRILYFLGSILIGITFFIILAIGTSKTLIGMKNHIFRRKEL